MNQDLENTFLAGVEQNKEKLLRICSVYAEDDDDKKDLFQEALIQIWRSMPAFEERSSLSTWMFRITLNVCLRLQSKQLKKRHRFLKMDSISIADIKDEETNHEEQEQLIQLRNCIRTLNDAGLALYVWYKFWWVYSNSSLLNGYISRHLK